MEDCLRNLIMLTVLCTLPGCIDPPKSPYVDVQDTMSPIDEL